jgi:hypothetical protein
MLYSEFSTYGLIIGFIIGFIYGILTMLETITIINKQLPPNKQLQLSLQTFIHFSPPTILITSVCTIVGALCGPYCVIFSMICVLIFLYYK